MKLIATAFLAIVACTASAADGPAAYIGIDGGQTEVDDFDENDTSYGIFGGYHFNRSFAIEAGYRRLADVSGTILGVPARARFNQAALSGIATLPLSDTFSLYGRLGYNHIEAEGELGPGEFDESESGALYGVGLGVALSPTLALRLEVQRPESDVTNVSLGLSASF